MTDNNRDKFIYIAGKYNQTVKFYNLDDKLYADKTKEILSATEGIRTHLTKGVFYRLLASSVIPNEVKKIIYLDGDVVVNLDINKLWSIEIGNYVLAAMPEITFVKNVDRGRALVRDGLVKKENYFNSGVLLINLEKFRQNLPTLLMSIKYAKENPQHAIFPDQDILNHAFSEQTLPLPEQFNSFVLQRRALKNPSLSDRIIHYAAGNTLRMNLDDVFNELFFRYFVKTPFFGEETIGNLHQAISRFYNGQKDFLLRMMNLLSKRQRAFFIEATEFEKMKKVFDIADNEEKVFSDDKTFSLVDNKVVSLPRDATVEELIKAMQKSKGKKVFYIINKNYGSIRNQLKSLGFVEWQDFLNGREVISEQLGGVQFLTHDFVKQM